MIMMTNARGDILFLPVPLAENSDMNGTCDHGLSLFASCEQCESAVIWVEEAS